MDDKAWQAGVTDHVLADAADHGAFDGAEASRPDHDHVCLLVFRQTTQSLAGTFRRLGHDLVFDLQFVPVKV